MKLSDHEILELNQLCGAVVDGTLTDAQRQRLETWLRESEAVRRYYVRSLGQSASLHAYAGEIHADAPDRRHHRAPILRLAGWALGGLAAAAALVLVWWSTDSGAPARELVPPAPSVARLTGTKEARWSGRPVSPGEGIALGQKLQLQSGAAEVTFASGARVVLQGAVAMDVNSAWDATLRYGTVKATVSPEAIGFRILNRAVEILDLGTEFSVTADENGATEVLVLKGEVEAAPRVGADADTIVLREHEARRFEATGISPVPDRERKLAQARQPVAFQRFASPVRYLHWSFDESDGGKAYAQAGAGGANPPEAELAASGFAANRIPGRIGRALRFDGELQLRGQVPGLSSAIPHTVAFWVKVPDEAPLSDAYAMVAWATKLKQLGSRPVQISWNRRPAEGTLGALRTDFGGGCAIGTTSLRDGRWHHVAVLFSPGESESEPVQVKQYVDGKLESSTIIPGRIRAPAGAGDAAIVDVLWLGCRLTGHQARDHFRGDIDELFIAEGSLEPNAIVRLARDNQLVFDADTAVAQR